VKEGRGFGGNDLRGTGREEKARTMWIYYERENKIKAKEKKEEKREACLYNARDKESQLSNENATQD